MLQVSLEDIAYSIGERKKVWLIEFYEGRREDEGVDCNEDQ